MKLTTEFKNKVIQSLKDARNNYGGSDAAFAKKYGMNSSVWSRLKNGELEKLLSETHWLTLGREMGVTPHERKWNTAYTAVFKAIESDVIFCRDNAKSMILVDDCAIGKTYTAKYLSRTLENCFYVDGSQAKTKQQFIRSIAKALGVDHHGRYVEVKANIKYYLNMLTQPVVIVDEAGDIDYGAFLELKELWNATDGVCGWYMMGADGLRAKIERGIRNQKVGYREILSRYSDKFMKIVPVGKEDRLSFYRKLIEDVINVNTDDKANIPVLVKKCLAGESGDIGGLRRAETILKLHTN